MSKIIIVLTIGYLINSAFLAFGVWAFVSDVFNQIISAL